MLFRSGSGGGGGGSKPSSPYITFGMVAGDIVGTACDPCPGKRFEAFVGCAISFLPLNCPLTILKAAWDIGSSCTSEGFWSSNCLKNISGAVMGAATSCVDSAIDLTPLGIGYNIAWCLYDIATACDSVSSSDFEAAITRLEELTGDDFSDLPMDDQTAALMYQQAQQLEKMLDGFTAIFGDPIWFSGTDTSGEVFDAIMTSITNAMDDTSDMGQAISETERQSLLALQLPSNITSDNVNALCDRWNSSLAYWSAGKYKSDDLDPGDNPDFIDAEMFSQKAAIAAAAAQDTLDQCFLSMFDCSY